MSSSREVNYVMFFMVLFVLGTKDKCEGARAVRNKALILRRTLIDSNVVDVTTYGAKGDGVTDDTKVNNHSIYTVIC